VKKRLGFLIAGSLGFGVLAAYPAHTLWGETALVYSAVALALCLVPTGATLLWADRVADGTPEQQLALVLGGTGVRMIFVLGAGLVLYYSVPYFQQPGFWLAVLVYYLLTLTLEMVLLVTGRRALDGRSGDRAGGASP
jgi:hypothetical protein